MSIVTKPKVDAVIVGTGWTGSIMARELLDAGLGVVCLERGSARETADDPMAMHDELKFSVRKTLMQDVSRETYTFRNDANQQALPIRRWGAFKPGDGVGGASMHWGGHTFRMTPEDFRVRSHYDERYGKSIFHDDSSVMDWDLDYAELERDFDFFEKVCGTAGKAGNIRGEIQAGGNPFEGPRSEEYPLPPMKQHSTERRFIGIAKDMGLHPFTGPVSNATRTYQNPYGARLYPCTYCGFCAPYDCGFRAKATPQLCILDTIDRRTGFEIRTGCHVTRINRHADGKSARSVTYVDNDGIETEQPADLVMLGAWTLNNVRLMLLSKIGQPYDPATRTGVMGKNYTHQTVLFAPLLYRDDVHVNSYMSAPGNGIWVGDYDGDNFDHSGLSFVGGGSICVRPGRGLPIGASSRNPLGRRNWGTEWKKNIREYYHRSGVLLLNGCSTASFNNYLDLDPTYKDHLGNPLLRITFDFPENDRRLAAFLADKAMEISEHLDLEKPPEVKFGDHYSIIPYQSTHNGGGTIMSNRPDQGVVNRYLQSWDVHNLFVLGGSVFPQNPSAPPTGTIGALTYWSARAIRERYLKSPGPLVG